MAPSTPETTYKDKKLTLFQRYQTLLSSYPVTMNIIQNAVITFFSIITSQWVSFNQHNPSHPMAFNLSHLIEKIVDWNEVYCMTFLSISFITPCIIIFYHFLDKYVDAKGIYKKLFIDQFLFAPVFNFFIIFFRMILLVYVTHQPVDMNDSAMKTLAILPLALKSSWGFWIPQRYFTLNYIPDMYQILFGSLCGFVWNVIFVLILSN